jgi:hypothetical protein
VHVCKTRPAHLTETRLQLVGRDRWARRITIMSMSKSRRKRKY